MTRVILSVAAVALFLTGAVKADYGYAKAKKDDKPAKKVYQPAKYQPEYKLGY